MLPVPQDRMSGRRSSSIVSRTLLGRRASVYATGQHQDPAKIMASTSALTMGNLASLVPEDEDEASSFRAILRSIQNNYPNEWKSWKVVDQSYEDLFGKDISSSMDSKLRFGIPTTDLVRAFYPEAKDLSERAYRCIRKILINWPLGRALVYSPHSIASKVHDPSYHEFMATIRELRTQGKLTNRDKTSKIMSSESCEQRSAHSTPLSRSSISKKTTREIDSDRDNRISTATKRRSEERGESPSPKRQVVAGSVDHSNSNHLFEVVVQKQMEMFGKILEMQSETNNNMKKIYENTHKQIDLNTSIDSVPDSTQEVEESRGRSPIIHWENENSNTDFADCTDDAEQAIRNEIASAQRRLEAIKATKATQHNGDTTAMAFDFKPCTTEIEPKFSKADPILAKQGVECQRLGTDNWKYIRYSEVQKQFQATPTFSALKVNNLLAGVAPSWTYVAILERMDLIMGAITNGLLQQRQIFEELCDKLPQDVKQRVGQEFLGNNSKFRKNSDALLQYVCGRRAEVIQQRRDTYKMKNKALHEIIHSIPPSDSHLFKEPELSQVVKDQGGIQKFFPFKKTFPPTSKTTYKPDYKNKKGRNYKKEFNKYNFNKNSNPSYGSGNKRTQYNNNEKQDKNEKGFEIIQSRSTIVPSRKMGINRCPFGCNQHNNRIPNSFSEKTSGGEIDKSQKIIRDPIFRGHERRDQKDVRLGGDSTKLTQNRIPVNNVFKKKTRWNIQTNFQLKKTEPICTCTKIQTVEPLPDPNDPKYKNLYDKSRYLTSLLSRAGSKNTSEIPIVSLRRNHLRDDMPTTRARKCPISLLKSNKLASTLVPTDLGCKSCSLPGRFFDRKSRPKNFKATNKFVDQQARRARLVGKQKEIGNRTIPVPRILRYKLGYRPKPEVALRCKDQANSRNKPNFSTEGKLELARRKSHPGKTEFCLFCSTFRKTTLPTTTDRFQQIAKAKAAQKVPDYQGMSRRVKLVDRKCSQKHGNSSRQPNFIHNYGCCRLGMGSHSKQSKTMGKLDGLPKTMALQPKRTLGSLRNLKKSRTTNTGKGNSLADRQSNGSCVCNKTRRHKVNVTLRNNKMHPTPMQTTQLQPNRTLHPRPIQWSGRQSIKNKKPTRVALETSNHRADFLFDGKTRSRFIRLKSVGSTTKLCKRRRLRQDESIHRRIQRNLALQPRLDISPASSHTESSPSSSGINRNLFTNSTELVQGILDASNKKACQSTTVGNTQSSIESSRPSDKSTTSESRPTQFAGLEGTGWAREILGWKDHEVQLLQASWRESTLKTYRPAWRRWLRWASEEKVRADAPKPTELARFLCYLHEVVKLAPRTILVHKSVVATFANPQDSAALSSHPIVAHALKGILSSKPKVNRPLSWNVSDLLKFLETYDFDFKSLFAVSRHTSILLLLASGRRVHDLTLLSLKSDLFEEHDNEMIFWPKYGSKTDSVKHRQSGWCLKNHPTLRLNLIHWIKQVILLSENRRKSKQIENLFITTRGFVKEASRAVIAGWIKTLFKEAQISSTAGSIRAGVATDNWTHQNMDIDEVLRRGNWKSKHTFFNHYLREVQSKTSISSNNNLTCCFNPV